VKAVNATLYYFYPSFYLNYVTIHEKRERAGCPHDSPRCAESGARIRRRLQPRVRVHDRVTPTEF